MVKIIRFRLVWIIEMDNEYRMVELTRKNKLSQL